MSEGFFIKYKWTVPSAVALYLFELSFALALVLIHSFFRSTLSLNNVAESILEYGRVAPLVYLLFD